MSEHGAAPGLSLIVPVYNEFDGVNRLLAHAVSLSGFADIVLVDASDNAASKACFAALTAQYAGHERVRFIRTERPGRARQMNLGAAQAGGSVLVFLHCDTRLPAEAGDLIRQSVRRGFAWGRFEVRLDSERLGIRWIQTMINLRSRLRRLATGDQVMFVTRACFARVGGFAEIALMEDIELSKRLRRQPPALIRPPVHTSARRWQQGGLCRTVLLMWALRLAFWLGANPARLALWYRDAR